MLNICRLMFTIFTLNIVCIPEQCVFKCTCSTSVHTNTRILCDGCFIGCYIASSCTGYSSQEMGPRRDHTATVFGSGHNFRLVVMFGGMWSLAGHLIAGTTLLHLGEWQFET